MVKLFLLSLAVLILMACAGQPASQPGGAAQTAQASKAAGATSVDWLSLGGRLSDQPAVSSLHYQVHEEGRITDTQSNVQWMACSLGQQWSEEGRCSGAIQSLGYPQALTRIEAINKQGFAGYSDWRLPTQSELLDLVQPEMLRETFPQSQPVHYWTGDQSSESGYYLAVSFRNGASQAWPAKSRFAVRLIRSSMPKDG